MKDMKPVTQKGFTLVEMAIVITIIGLLIGGILKGKSILDNARITGTVTQIGTIDSAVKLFKDTYNAQLPGDMLNANDRLPNCGKCGAKPDTTVFPATVSTGTDGAGNGIVGRFDWDLSIGSFQSSSYNAPSCPTNGTGCPAAASLPVDAETVLFWYELAAAGLLSGITDDGLNGVTESFGGSLPAARIGGGFTVGAVNMETTPVSSLGMMEMTNTMPAGMVLALIPFPGSISVTDIQVLTPAQAASIDRRMDDGAPDSGNVRPFGSTDCFTTTMPSVWIYQEAKSEKACGLAIAINRP